MPPASQGQGSGTPRHSYAYFTGSGSNPTVCDETQTPTPQLGQGAVYNCFLEPNSTITLEGQDSPAYTSNLTCTTRSWSIVYSNVTPPIPYLTAQISPAGSGGGTCHQIDDEFVTLTTGNDVPQDFGAYLVQGEGAWCYSLCDGGTPQKEDALSIGIYPGLHIKDTLLNQHIENKTITHVAGQWMHIKPEMDKWGLNTCTWTMPTYFPGDAENSYVTNNSATSASPVPSTPIPNPTPSGTYDVGWYNIKAESPQQIQVACQISDGGSAPLTLTAVAQIGFETPQPNISVSYPSVVDNWTSIPDTNCYVHTGLYLGFGGACVTGSPPPGINWTYSISASDTPEQGGVIGLWQVVNSATQITQWPDPSNNQDLTSSNCADGQVPYATSQSGTRGGAQTWNVSGGWYDADGPGQLSVQGATYVELDHTFDDYLMYKPQDGADGKNSIWISLGHFQWGFQASESDPVAGMHPTVVYQTPAPVSLDNATPTPSFPGACQ